MRSSNLNEWFKLFAYAMGCCFLVAQMPACDEQTRSDMFPNLQKRTDNMTYVKDHRTNLCFAHSTIQSGHAITSDSFTNVPCTPEVEALLVK